MWPRVAKYFSWWRADIGSRISLSSICETMVPPLSLWNIVHWSGKRTMMFPLPSRRLYGALSTAKLIDDLAIDSWKEVMPGGHGIGYFKILGTRTSNGRVDIWRLQFRSNQAELLPRVWASGILNSTVLRYARQSRGAIVGNDRSY